MRLVQRSLACLARLVVLTSVVAAPSLADAPASAGNAAPMTNEDVVKRLVAGTPIARILEEIESRPPAFDLSDEMVDELRLAGVPQVVLDAMTRRQREASAAPEDQREAPPAPTAPPGPVVVEIEVRDPSGGAVPLAVPARLSPQAAAALGDSGLADSPAAVEGLAVFLACTTARHVPDYWRNRSPLGRDFQMPRHRMVLYLPGGEPVEGRRLPPALRSAIPKPARGQRWVVFTPPSTAEIELDRDDAHDLLVGVAMQVGGRNVRLAAQAMPGWRLPEGADRLRLLVLASWEGGAPGFRFDLEMVEPAGAH